MEALARLDQALIDAAEKALFAGRTKLGLSFPAGGQPMCFDDGRDVGIFQPSFRPAIFSQ